MQSKKVGKRTSTNRNDDGINFELFAFTECHDSSTRRGWCMTFDSDTRTNVNVLFLERLHDNIGNVGVEAGKNLGEAFQNRDGRTKVGKR